MHHRGNAVELQTRRSRVRSNSVQMLFQITRFPPLPSACAAQDCLSLFFEQTILTGGEQMLCSVCGLRRETTVFTCLDDPPEVLMLHLKRWVEPWAITGSSGGSDNTASITQTFREILVSPPSAGLDAKGRTE